MTLETLRDICKDAAQRAGEVLLKKRSTPRQLKFKERGDLVTDADLASEKVILDILAQATPNDAILSEESGTTPGKSGRTWIVDPLDGTTNYAHGLPHYCVTLAVEDEHGMAASATYLPHEQELYLAARGMGTTLNGQPIRCSSATSLEHAMIAGGLPFTTPTALVELLQGLGKARALRRFGASALELAWVAAGRLEAYWEPTIKPWDMAAGVLLVQEAGGTVTGFSGEAIHPLPLSICAGAPAIQANLLSLFRNVPPP